MAYPTYNSRLVTASWGGVILSGFAPDSFITFSRNSDYMEGESGGDGGVSVSKLPDRTGTCTMQFQQGSGGASILYAALAKQDADESMFSATLLIVDPSGSVLAKLSGARVMSAGEVDLGSSANGKTRSFTFFVEDMDYVSVPTGLTEAETDPAIAAGVATLAAFDTLNS